MVLTFYEIERRLNLTQAKILSANSWESIKGRKRLESRSVQVLLTSKCKLRRTFAIYLVSKIKEVWEFIANSSQNKSINYQKPKIRIHPIIPIEKLLLHWNCLRIWKLSEQHLKTVKTGMLSIWEPTACFQQFHVQRKYISQVMF